MSCDEIRKELPFYARGESTEASINDIRGHLAHCAGCEAESRDVGDLLEALEMAGHQRIRPELRAEVLERVAGLHIEDRLRRHVSLPPDGMRDRVLSSLRPGAPLVLDEVARRRHRRDRFLLKVTSVAALLALLGFAVSYVRMGDLERDLGVTSAESSRLEERTGPVGHEMQTIVLAGRSEAVATLDHYRHDNFRLNLSVAGYDITPPGFQYAVWLRGEEGDVPLGGFRLKREDDFLVPLAIAVDPVRYPELVVTLEPLDGNPELTGEIVNSALLDVDSVHHGAYND